MSESKPDYIYNVSDNICKKKSKKKCNNGCVYEFSSKTPGCNAMTPVHKRYCRCLLHVLVKNNSDDFKNRSYKYNPYGVCRSSTKIKSDRVIRCKQHYDLKQLKYLSKINKNLLDQQKSKYDYTKELQTYYDFYN